MPLGNQDRRGALDPIFINKKILSQRDEGHWKGSSSWGQQMVTLGQKPVPRIWVLSIVTPCQGASVLYPWGRSRRDSSLRQNWATQQTLSQKKNKQPKSTRMTKACNPTLRRWSRIGNWRLPGIPSSFQFRQPGLAWQTSGGSSRTAVHLKPGRANSESAWGR